MIQTIHGDCLTVLQSLPSDSVQCCITSPPYYRMRTYGTKEHPLPPMVFPAMSYSPMVGVPPVRLRKSVVAELGHERTPLEFVGHIVAVFREVRRVLKPDGVCWVNFGDSYAQKGGRGEQGANSQRTGRKNVKSQEKPSSQAPAPGFKPKDKYLVPLRVVLALQADGWWARQDVIWYKLNPSPETVADRPTTAHEYLFMLTKSARYYYDAQAIKEPCSDLTHPRGPIVFDNVTSPPLFELPPPDGKSQAGVNKKARAPKTPENWDTNKGAHGSYHKDGRDSVKRHERVKNPPVRNRTRGFTTHHQTHADTIRPKQNAEWSANMAGTNGIDLRNKRSVWPLQNEGYPGAHFATFPPDLIRPCVLSSTRPGDTILDPFAGSGTVGQVALEYGRGALLIELGSHHLPLIATRTAHITPPLFPV